LLFFSLPSLNSGDQIMNFSLGPTFNNMEMSLQSADVLVAAAAAAEAGLNLQPERNPEATTSFISICSDVHVSSGKRSADQSNLDEEILDDESTSVPFRKMARLDSGNSSGRFSSPSGSTPGSLPSFETSFSNRLFNSPSEVSFWGGPLNDTKNMLLSLFPPSQLVHYIFNSHGQVEVSVPGIGPDGKTSVIGLLSKYRESFYLSSELKKTQTAFNSLVLTTKHNDLKLAEYGSQIKDLNYNLNLSTSEVAKTNNLLSEDKKKIDSFEKRIPKLEADLRESELSHGQTTFQFNEISEKYDKLEVEIQGFYEENDHLKASIKELKSKQGDLECKISALEKDLSEKDIELKNQVDISKKLEDKLDTLKSENLKLRSSNEYLQVAANEKDSIASKF
jgi:hypothetical protein